MGQTQPTLSSRSSSIVSHHQTKLQYMEATSMQEPEGIGCCALMHQTLSKNRRNVK